MKINLIKFVKFILIIPVFIYFGCNSSRTIDVNNKFKNHREYKNLADFLTGKLEQYRKDTTVDVTEIAQDYYIRGLNDISNENYMQAIYNFEYALKLDKSATIYISLAEAYLAVNNIYNALESAINAYKLDEKNQKSLEIMFSIFSFAGDFESAEKVGAELYGLNPTTKNLLQLADFYSSFNNPRAIKFYEEYLQKVDDSNAEDKYVSALINDGKSDSALRQLLKSLKNHKNDLRIKQIIWLSLDANKINFIDSLYYLINTDCPSKISFFYDELMQTLANSAQISTENENFSKKYVEIIKQIDSINVKTDLNTAFVATYIRDTNSVELFCERVLAKTDTNQTYPLICSEMFKRIGKSDSELKTLLKFKDTLSENDDYLLMIAYWYYQNKQFPEALKYFIEYKDKRPEDAIRYTNLGDTYEKLNDLTKAEEFYKKALELDSDNAGANNNYAYFLTRFPERLEEAENYSKNAILLEPENPAFLDTFGWIKFLQNNHEEALTNILEASKLDNNNWEIFDHLGDIYFSLGEKKKAIEAWEVANKINPDNIKIIEKINLNK